MNERSDQELLRDYAERQSEPAFAELLRRHVDFVYSAALRMVCDSHTAEDVTQNTFIALAKNASEVRDRSVLSSWLHSTARNLAANTVRNEVRRRAREQEAAAMNELLANEPEFNWKNIAPHLDDAIAELGDSDRDALLLRYFERKSAREMGQIFGTSEEAAQKRVSRAVERLREFFSKRGVTIGAGGLVVLISANAVHAAPVALTGTISTALAGATIHTSTAVAATKVIAMTTLQKALIGATIAVALGTGIFEAHRTSQSREEYQALEQQKNSLAAQIGQLQHERDDATRRLEILSGEHEQSKSNQTMAELLNLRSKVTQFETEEKDPVNSMAKDWLVKVNKLKQRLEETPGAKIPELQFLKDEDWLNATKNRLSTEVDYRQALATLRNAGESRFAHMLQDALQKYGEGKEQFPNDLAQLQPYFDAPVDPAMLDRWEIVPAKKSGLGGDAEITQKTTPDDLFDSRFTIGVRGYGSGSDFLSLEFKGTLGPVYQAFQDAHNGKGPQSNAELMPFATTPEQITLIKKMAERDELVKSNGM